MNNIPVVTCKDESDLFALHDEIRERLSIIRNGDQSSNMPAELLKKAESVIGSNNVVHIVALLMQKMPEGFIKEY